MGRHPSALRALHDLRQPLPALAQSDATEAGARATRLQVLLYTIALAPLGLAPWFLGFAGPAYAAAATLLGLGFLWHAWRVWRERQDALGRSLENDAAAKRTFRYSLLYLAALFAALPLDRLISA